jgi:hypothetical protein
LDDLIKILASLSFHFCINQASEEAEELLPLCLNRALCHKKHSTATFAKPWILLTAADKFTVK